MVRFLFLAFLLLTSPVLAQDDTVIQPPGGWMDSFDDGVIAGEISPVGGASIREEGGQLIVTTSQAFDGVRVTFPSTSGPEPVWPFCVMVGFDVARLADGQSIVFRVFDPQIGEIFTRADEKEKVRWEITKVDATTYNYKVYKDGKLVASGQARIPAGSKGFRIDKKPGTNMIIGEVILPDGRWEKLWEKDPPPPELPFTAVEITSDAESFALDEVGGGLHTDDPNTVGALGDLTFVPVEEGGLRFLPLGGDLFDIEVELESLATFASEGETLFPLSLAVGDQLTEVEVKCRGTGTGTCSGQSACDTKTCPDREYDIGDGNGYRTYTGTCKLATIGLPLCSCSYKIKKTFSAVAIQPGEIVSAIVDRTNVVPEFTEGDNQVSASPVRQVYAAPQLFYCGGVAAGTTPPSRGMMLQATIRVAGVGPVIPGSVNLMVSSVEGGLAGPFTPVATSSEGSTAYLSFYVPPSAGLSSLPERLILMGASPEGGSLTFWTAETDARVIGDEEIDGQAAELIHQLGTIEPSTVELGTPITSPNDLSAELLAFGDLALPAIHQALSTGTRYEQAWSAFVAGLIGNPSSIGPLSALADQISHQIEFNTEDYAALGSAQQALIELQAADSDVVDLPADKRCCVTDVDAVTDAAFEGGKKAGDYYPDLVGKGYWKGDGGTAGGFDTGTSTGVLVQIVGTMDGDRACCHFTQHFVIEESNYPGAGKPYGDSAPVGKRVDDVAKSGRNFDKPPARQDLGPGKTSIADPMSRGYGPTSNFKRTQRFESCFESYAASKPPCVWSKCCVTWVVHQEVVNGKATQSVTEVGTFCE
jgi:hypothetical protein